MSTINLSGLLNNTYQGDTGFVGSKGDTGFTGSKGETGFTGSKGEASGVTTGKAIAMAIVFGG